MGAFIDITGCTFGEWKVNTYNKINKLWECTCSCGNCKLIASADLRRGKTTNCGCKRKNSLKGLIVSNMKVEEYNGNYRWVCRCMDCSKLWTVHTYFIEHNKMTKCTHSNKHINLIDETGKIYDDIVVLNYLKKKIWECRCKCGMITIYTGKELTSHSGTICKHDKIYKYTEYKETIFDIFKMNINKLKDNNIRQELKTTNISYKYINWILEQLEIPNDEKKNGNIFYGTSKKEKNILTYIRDIYKGEIIENNRTILSGQEIDIYLPKENVGIEFNGTRFHSDSYKDKHYHYNKTNKCAKLGIRLVHLYEYEFMNTSDALNRYINGLVNKNKTVLMARKLIVKYIDINEEQEFLYKYDIYGYKNSNICIGLIDRYNDVVAIMAFKHIKDSIRDYEMCNLCFKNDIIICGGSEKMLKYFIDYEKVERIIAYCNKSKFTGEVYKRLGFKSVNNDIEYTWANEHGKLDTKDTINISEKTLRSNRCYKIYGAGIDKYELVITEN